MHDEWSGAIVGHDETCQVRAGNLIGARVVGEVVLAVIELGGEAGFELAAFVVLESVIALSMLGC